MLLKKDVLKISQISQENICNFIKKRLKHRFSCEIGEVIIPYTMFISSNRALFHFWWKEDLVKHQRFPKYYENDCSLAHEGNIQTCKVYFHNIL